MGAAAKAGEPIDALSVIELCEWVLTRPIEERTTPEQRDEGPRLNDYFDLGINSPRGKAMEAGFAYARWVATHLATGEERKDFDGGYDVMPEFREMLEWQIAPEHSTVEAMSIVGSRMGLMYWLDKRWLAENAARLFHLEGIAESPPTATGWAAWNAFLVWVRPHIEFYRLFKRQFAYSVDEAAKVEAIDRSRHQPMQHLGEHLMVLYGRGQLGLGDDDGLLRRFVGSAGPDIRRHAIRFVGGTLKGDEPIPEDVLERFMALWDVYWDGPGKGDAANESWLFGVWFASGQFPPDWALERLSRSVEVMPTPEPDYEIVERLAEVAGEDVGKAVDILDRMVRGDREGWRTSGWKEPAKEVLRQGMAAGGHSQHQAESLINYLGRRGYIEFGELLNAR